MLNYSCSIMFNRIDFKDKILFLPMCLCIGEYDKENDLFFDYMSNSVLPNINDSAYLGTSVSFGHVRNLSIIFKQNKRFSLKNSLLKYVSALRKEIIMATFDVDSKKYVFKTCDVDEIDEEDFIITFPTKTEQIERLKEEREMLEKVIDELGEEYAKSLQPEEDEKELIKISDLYEGVKSEVISQDSQVKKIITAIYKNLMFDGREMKSNILIYGPSGVGKTQILRSLSKRIGIPLWIEDMTKYTESGYKGGDVEDILYNLLENANMNQKLAERSILVLDEIDKKAGNNGDSEVSKSDVLKGLLAIIEGGVFPLQYAEGQINFDTSKLTIVACGAFTELRDNKMSEKKTIGFSRENSTVMTNPEISIEDFQKFGMPLEFMGRFRTIVQMNELKKEDFIKILKTSALSPLNKYCEEMTKLGIKFEVTDVLYERLATQALKYKTGARALNVVVDQMFEDILFDVFDNTGGIESVNLSDKEDGVKLELRKRGKYAESVAEGRK